jgi:hypothetical protein
MSGQNADTPRSSSASRRRHSTCGAEIDVWELASTFNPHRVDHRSIGDANRSGEVSQGPFGKKARVLEAPGYTARSDFARGGGLKSNCLFGQYSEF